MAVLGLIDVICACASKKRQGARIAMIVFGSLGILSGLFTPLSLPGILVLAGGIAGVTSRKAERQGGAAEGVQGIAVCVVCRHRHSGHHPVSAGGCACRDSLCAVYNIVFHPRVLLRRKNRIFGQRFCSGLQVRLQQHAIA